MTLPARPRRRLSALGAVGELLVTAGVVVLLFVAWETWFNTWVLDSRQTTAATQLGEQWLDDIRPPASKPGTTVIPVGTAPAATQPVGVIYVPRFGHDWKRIIRETVDVVTVLNSEDAGVGHYPGTAMPGGVGNFAVAAHDTGWGDAFLHMKNLRLGDRIYVQTRDGFYTYVFRNYEYVQPDAIEVLDAVPGKDGAEASARIMTMTTCNPAYHGVERLVAYGVFQSFSRTPPAAIAGEVG